MPRPPARRSLLPAIVALIAASLVGSIGASIVAPSARAAVAITWPIQSLGDRGTDVLAIQHLLRHHQRAIRPPVEPGRGVGVGGINVVVVPADAIFGATTVAGVKAFQGSRDLPRTGIVEAATWADLVLPVAQGATGEPVRAIQRLLHEKYDAAVPLDGVFGATTRSALMAFQTHIGLPRTGTADAPTWRNLAWHYELPHFSRAGLCDYSSTNGPANWGTAEAVATIESAGAAMVGRGFGRVAVGDVSLEHGGDIAGHTTHEVGLDIDLRPMQKAGRQCAGRTRWNLSSYDRARTRELVMALRAATPGHVKLIYFNDPVLIGEGLTTRSAGHDDHLHLRVCEAWHVDARYRC